MACFISCLYNVFPHVPKGILSYTLVTMGPLRYTVSIIRPVDVYCHTDCSPESD